MAGRGEIMGGTRESARGSIHALHLKTRALFKPAQGIGQE